MRKPDFISTLQWNLQKRIAWIPAIIYSSIWDIDSLILFVSVRLKEIQIKCIHSRPLLNDVLRFDFK